MNNVYPTTASGWLFDVYLDGDGNTAFITSVGNPSVPLPTVLIAAKNSGFGISMDQVLTENLGLWVRLGVQDGDVSQFDRHFSGGIQLSGGAFDRPDDVIGVGVAYTLISDAYKKASGLSSNELYAEAYYNSLFFNLLEFSGKLRGNG